MIDWVLKEIERLKQIHRPEFEHTVVYEDGWIDALEELETIIKKKLE